MSDQPSRHYAHPAAEASKQRDLKQKHAKPAKVQDQGRQPRGKRRAVAGVRKRPKGVP